MKKLILILLLAIVPPVFAAGVGVSGSGVGGMPSAPVFSGTVSSTKACASGFARIGPNFCKRVGTQLGISVGFVGTSAACTLTTALSGVADAKAVRLAPEFLLYSRNAVGNLVADVSIFLSTETTCSGGSQRLVMSRNDREWIALAANTFVSSFHSSAVIESNGAGQFRFTSNIFTGGASTGVTLWVQGYFD